MSNSDNNHKKDFVMSNGIEDAEPTDAYEDEPEEVANSSFQKSSLAPSILAAAGFVVMVALVIVIFIKISNLAQKDQLLTLGARIDVLEHKMAVLEQAPLAGEPAGQLEQLTERFNNLEAGVNSKIDNLSNELKSLKQPETVPTKTTKPEAVQPVETAKKELKVKVHKVRAGETLYRISRQYGLTVEQLRTYNHLKPDAVIYVGQELKLGPAAGN
jgi:LysM repeat protein